MFWEGHFIPQDVGESGVAVLALEGSRAEQHLINQYSQRPPINGTCVTVSFDDFGCNIFFCSDKRVGPKVGNARLRVDQRVACRVRAVSAAQDHGWCAARIGLF